MNKIEISLQEALEQHATSRIPSHLITTPSQTPDSSSTSVRVNFTAPSFPKCECGRNDFSETDERTRERRQDTMPGAVNRSQECCGEAIRFFWAEDGRHLGVCRHCGNKVVDSTQLRDSRSPWIGVDLDGTLATETESRGSDEIGAPIEPMAQRVKAWVSQGKTVKIFTARAANPRQVVLIQEWLKQYGFPDLEITNVKDFRMVQLWDDRCVRVATNVGEPMDDTNAEKVPQRKHTRTSARRAQPNSFFSTLRFLLTF